MKLYERIENNNFDEIDRNRAIELIEGGNGHLVYNENYFQLQKENEELREKWDKDTHILQNELDLTNADKINNYIPIQKVKDNLIKYQEEYELLLEHQSGKESNRTKYLRGRMHMCQELLEGRK